MQETAWGFYLRLASDWMAKVEGKAMHARDLGMAIIP